MLCRGCPCPRVRFPRGGCAPPLGGRRNNATPFYGCRSARRSTSARRTSRRPTRPPSGGDSSDSTRGSTRSADTSPISARASSTRRPCSATASYRPTGRSSPTTRHHAGTVRAHGGHDDAAPVQWSSAGVFLDPRSPGRMIAPRRMTKKHKNLRDGAESAATKSSNEIPWLAAISLDACLSGYHPSRSPVVPG